MPKLPAPPDKIVQQVCRGVGTVQACQSMHASLVTLVRGLRHRLQAYQLMPSGITKLPPFQIAASKPAASGGPPAMPQLDARDVHLVTLYGRVYCAYLEAQSSRLLMYRFYS